MKKLLTLILLCILWGCGSRGTKDRAASLFEDTLYHTKYATGFELFRDGESSVLRVKNPWQGAQGVEKLTYLSRNGEVPPEGFDGETVKVPVKRVVCMSSSYIAFLDALECDSVISGVSGAGYILTPGVRQRLESGKAVDVGADNSLNYELLASLKPDVVLTYGISGENSAMTNKLHELGIKVVYIGEYLENSPLGRAEWVRVMGEFTDRGQQAETLFDSVSRAYENARALAAKVEQQPQVMLNAPWRDSWFVPGDRSYIVRLIEDAGGRYTCAGVDSDQSRPISLENAFIAAAESDIWLNPGSVNTLQELLTLNPKFKTIPPVKNGQVFNNNARTTPGGGSDFWESGVINPHLALEDMIRIFHPELLPDHTLYYFHQLQ